MTDTLQTTAIAIADRIIDGFNRGDVASFGDCLHPDIVANFPFAPPVMPKELSGKAAVHGAMAEGRALMETMTISVLKTYWISEDATLVVEATGSARLLGGIPYNNRYIFLIGFRDGQVVLWREYFDSLLMQNALDQQAR